MTVRPIADMLFRDHAQKERQKKILNYDETKAKKNNFFKLSQNDQAN